MVVNLRTRQEKQLTDGASETVNWGVAEFVAQEEMGRFTGYWWAPGDRYIAAARVDDGPVKIVTRAAIGSTGTRTFNQSIRPRVRRMPTSLSTSWHPTQASQQAILRKPSARSHRTYPAHRGAPYPI